MVIANKLDLVEKDPVKRQVRAREVQQLVDEFELVHLQTSAMTGHNVQ